MTTCHECGGTVSLRSAAGLSWEIIPGVRMEIPASIKVARCDTCDDFSLDAADVKRIEAALKPQAREWLVGQLSQAVRCLRERDGVSIGQIEAAAGVTHTYLSHASHPTRGRPSLTLVRLLQAFIACPEELRRHLERRPTPTPWWQSSKSGARGTHQPIWLPEPSTPLATYSVATTIAERRFLREFPAANDTYLPPKIISQAPQKGASSLEAVSS